MGAFPYRVPAPIEPEPAPAPPSEAARIGSFRSSHAPPPLWKALSGPLLIAGLIVGLGFVSGCKVAVVTLALAVATFTLLAWSPIRTRGESIALHAQGLVLSRAGARSVVPFEDVNEVWFEISEMQTSAGAYLRALRLVNYGGGAHRVPLEVNDGIALMTGVLRGCSMPLLIEARRALAAGEVLTFGQIRLDRAGITIHGARAAWRDLRLARVQSARVAFFRRLPLLAWRTVSLDCIPNPTVFTSLVADNMAQVKQDDPLIMPLSEQTAQSGAREGHGTQESVELALRNVLIGGLICLAGIGITWFTYRANNDSYVIALGPIIYGGIRFFRGVARLKSRPPR